MRHVNSDERINLLRGVWLFERCTRRELAALARMATPLTVEQGRELAREGTAGEEFVVVVDGVASATIHTEELAQIGPGSFFGELALLDGGPRTATVRAQTPMLVLVLSRSDFDSLVDRAIPSVGRRMLVILAERLRAADARVAGTAERLAGI